jgi:hypothetical protein
MNIQEILNGIRKTFNKSKLVEMKDLGLTFEIESLTSEEELKVLEACKDIDGASYISWIKRYSLAYAIKKLNGLVIPDDVSYEEEGKNKSKSKFLYMGEQIAQWPSSLLDMLFEVYTNLQTEIENTITSKVKFELFTPSEPLKEPTENKFKRIEEKEEEGETETDKLNKIVKKELEQAETHLATQTEKLCIRTRHIEIYRT